MQIRKTYRQVNPDLLHHQIADFLRKQGAEVLDAKLETYSLPTDSSSFITRATLSFGGAGETGKGGKEVGRVLIVGSAKGETKLMLDIDEKLFADFKVNALQEDINFIFGAYELKVR